jgi:hypothetical protein
MPTINDVALSVFDKTSNETFNGKGMNHLKVDQDFRIQLADGNVLCIPKVRGWLTDTETSIITVFDLYWRHFKIQLLGWSK